MKTFELAIYLLVYIALAYVVLGDFAAAVLIGVPVAALVILVRLQLEAHKNREC